MAFSMHSFFSFQFKNFFFHEETYFANVLKFVKFGHFITLFYGTVIKILFYLEVLGQAKESRCHLLFSPREREFKIKIIVRKS